MKFLTIIFLLLPFSLMAQSNFEPCGKEYGHIIVDERDGEILSQDFSDKVIYPASLTKLMTLYLAFEAIEEKRINPSYKIPISAYAEDIGKINRVNTLKLKEGDKISVSDAIKGSIVKSFNETMVAIAEAIDGSEWKFVNRMNKKAKELNMINTSFRNSTGLHQEGHYSTNYDLIRLTIAIKRDFPHFYHLFSLKEFSFAGVKYKTHNHFLDEYKWSEGMKTGFTSVAGYNLIASAKKKDVRLMSSLTGCSTYQKRDELTKDFFNLYFDRIFSNQENEIKTRLVKNPLYLSYEEDDEKAYSNYNAYYEIDYYDEKLSQLELENNVY